MHDQSHDAPPPDICTDERPRRRIVGPAPGHRHALTPSDPGHRREVTRSDPGHRCEVTELYENLAPRLERIVRLDVQAPEAVIEDACQFAWSRLLDHFERVRRDAALSWLATTAVREAFRSIRRATRELSLEGTLETSAEPAFTAKALSAEEMLEHADRLGSLRTLPRRQQRLLWLQGLGLSYREMARHERCTRRTVERQLLRAKGSLRAIAVTAPGRTSGLAR